MKEILLTNHYEESVFNILEGIVPHGFQITMLEKAEETDLLKKIPQADYLLASGRVNIGTCALEAAHRLKMIQRTGVGTDTVDLQAAGSKGIPVYINAGINAQSVAEHTLLLILACMRNLVEIHAKTRQGIWEKQKQGIRAYELRGKNVGLIGFGNIGKKTAALLRAFGANVFYFKRIRLSPAEEEKLQIQYKDMDRLLEYSDIISIHCPLTQETRHLIDGSKFSIMKKGAVLVNTSRGCIVDQKELISALENGKLRMAALDVFEEEPLLKEHEFSRLENVILTPHIGGVTFDSFYRMMEQAIGNIAAFDQGGYKDPYLGE